MSNFKKLINASDLIEWIMEAFPDWCVGSVRSIVDYVEALPSAQPEQWIPVTERLPEEEVQVLVTDDAGGLATIDVDCGYFDEEYGRFEWFHSQNVTAWMPLPEPYAERWEGNG